jgi:hypothetical protein
VNGIRLPGNSSIVGTETPHNETMRDSYYRYLREQFSGSDGSRAHLEVRLAQIKDDLKNRRQDFPPKN